MCAGAKMLSLALHHARLADRSAEYDLIDNGVQGRSIAVCQQCLPRHACCYERVDLAVGQPFVDATCYCGGIF